MKIVRLLGNLADINDTQAVKTLICAARVSEGRKEIYVNAYDYYTRFRGLSWNKPKFVREDRPIYLPLESELDLLISNAKIRLSTFLHFLKETGVDSGEAWKLRWIDVDVERKTVSITPTKNHNSRILPVSSNLIARLLRLPHVNDRVFGARDLDDFRTNYGKTRNKLSIKLQNPRLRQIAFKSFRHFRATQLYCQTKDILFVQHWLGHKRIENTLIYTHLINLGSDDFICKVAKTVEEAAGLIESGFEYVTEIDGVKLFKKRK